MIENVIDKLNFELSSANDLQSLKKIYKKYVKKYPDNGVITYHLLIMNLSSDINGMGSKK